MLYLCKYPRTHTVAHLVTPPYTRYALTMHSLCTHYALLTMQYTLCTHYALTMHYSLCIIRLTLYTVSRHTVHQHLTVLPSIHPLCTLLYMLTPAGPGAASTLSAARLHAVLVCWARPSPPMFCAGAGWYWWCDCCRQKHHHIERLHLQRKHRGTQSIECIERSRRAAQMLFHRKNVLLPRPI
jgi:hypothetical protein